MILDRPRNRAARGGGKGPRRLPPCPLSAGAVGASYLCLQAMTIAIIDNSDENNNSYYYDTNSYNTSYC